MEPKEILDGAVKTADTFTKLAHSALEHAPTVVAILWTTWFAAALSFFNPIDLRFAILCGAWLATVFFVATWWYALRHVRSAKFFLKHLGQDEKDVLQLFIRQSAATRHVNVFYAPTASLIAKGILVNATSVIPPLKAPVVMETRIFRYLMRKPELIDLKREDVGADKYEDEAAYLTRP